MGFYSAERASRGEVIITQKEAKGEYGSNTWLWNRDTANGMPAEYGNQEIEPHVFDNTNGSGVPARMTNFGTAYDSNSYCASDMMITEGEILTDGQQMSNQKSCSPDGQNVGNYYGWVAAAAGDNVSSGEASDSICPKGWQLPNDKAYTEDRSFAKIVYAYTGLSKNIGSSGETYVNLLKLSPFLVPRAGYYYYSTPTPYHRKEIGRITSNQASSRTNNGFLSIGSGFIQSSNAAAEKGRGYSVRCVAR